MLSGGEAMDRALALSFRRVLPGVRLGNFYGPTEATVDSAWYEVGEQLPERPIVPIGRPIANAQLYMLDAGPAAPTRQRRRRAVRRRARRGARLPEPSRTQRRALPAQSLPARRDHVSHRRLGALAARRRGGIHRAQRRPGQAAWLSDRARGDRGRTGCLRSGANECRGACATSARTARSWSRTSSSKGPADARPCARP